MISNSTIRWVIFIANIVAFILALVMFIQPDKFAGKTDGIHLAFAVLFIIDALCVAP